MSDILTITEYQTIYISKYRDLSTKTISYEDRELLFNILFTDSNDNKKFVFENNGSNKIKATSIVGSISLKNGLIIEILPKFAKVNLNDKTINKYRNTLVNMISVANEKSYIIAETTSSKKSLGELPLIKYIIELFSIELLEVLRTGLSSTYEKTTKSSSNIRGNILVTKTIQNSIIDKSKIYISYNTHTSNNHLMKVFKSLANLLINDSNLSYNSRQNFYEIYSLLDNVSIVNLVEKDFSNIVFNRLNDKFEILFKKAEYIYKQYMPFVSAINASPFWSILFDMDTLFEKFLSYLFRKSNLNFIEQSKIDSYSNRNHTVSIKPDFIIKSDDSICVVDAKWKLIDNRKQLYGLDSQNFWQIHSYMNLVDTKKEINGYFIVPKNSEYLDDLIVFKNLDSTRNNISVIAIDFSLDFKDIVENYSFSLVNNELLINYKIPIVLDEFRIYTKSFNLKNLVNDFNFVILLGQKSLVIFKVENGSLLLLETISYPCNYMENSINLLTEEHLNKKNSKTLFFSSKDYIIENNLNDQIDKDFAFIDISFYSYTKLIDREIFNRDDFYYAINFFDSHIPDYKEAFIANIEYTSLVNDFYIKKEKQTILKSISNKRASIVKKLKENNRSLIKSDKKLAHVSSIAITDKNYNPLSSIELEFLLQNNDYEALKTKIDDSINRDDVRIILFFRNYEHYELKIKIQDYLINNSNKILVETLFESKILNIVDFFENNIKKLDLKKIDWLYGFSLLNNDYVYKIKQIIASNTTSSNLLEILSSYHNENKILNGIAFNPNSSNELLDKITNITITYDYKYIAKTLLKRQDLSFCNLCKLLEYFNDIEFYNIAENIFYYDSNCSEYIKNRVPEHNISIFNYDQFTHDDKLDFVIEAKFDLYDSDLIKKLCYETNTEILLELVADKHNTLKLRFLILVYTLNFKNWNFKEEELFKAIKLKNNQDLNEIVEISEKLGVKGVVEYLESNFENLNKEILFGYSMNNLVDLLSIRRIICDFTNDLEILNELSKNKNDEAILRRIILKPRHNNNFREIIKGHTTIYSSLILNRIAHYSHYYEKENEGCIIYLLSKDFNTSVQTKRYIFEEYAEKNNDSLLATNIYFNISNSKNRELIELSVDIRQFLNSFEKQLYSKIDFNQIK